MPKRKSEALNPAAGPVSRQRRAPSESWGGVRNLADRTSDAISQAKARSFLEAVEHAERIRLPLNRHCTIHWERAGVADADAARATGAYLKHAHDWLRVRGLTFAYAYARENGAGKGSHAHILLHVPQTARKGFVRAHVRWAKAAARQNSRLLQGAVRSVPIGGASACDGAGPVYADNLAYVVGYVLKGVTRVDALVLQLRRRPNRDGSTSDDWGDGGRIVGKRVGWSENIGAAARSHWLK